MKMICKLGMLTALVTLLGACGLVNSFIPDQPVNNALGLDGKEVELGQQPSLLAPQQAATYSGQLTATFADFDASDVPDAVNPNTLKEILGIEPSFEVTAAAAENDFAPELTLSASELSLSISDASGPTINKSYGSEDNLGIAFTKGDCEVAALTMCTYTTSLTEVVLLSLSIGGADLDRLYKEILTDNDSPNGVSGSFSLELDGTVPAGASVKVTLDTQGGTLTF